MTEAYDLRLAGCAPEPLMHYLKALGALRLVATQADPTAQGYWQGDTFHLVTALDRQALLDFVLDRYTPTPVIAPWNGGSGFWDESAAGQALARIAEAPSDRFALYQGVIRTARRVIDRHKLNEAPKDEAKAGFLRTLRNTLPEEALDWLDAATVLGEERPVYFPLLGTGGNDGRLDFTANFMQRLDSLIPFDGEWSPPGKRPKKGAGPIRAQSHDWLLASLFADGNPALVDAAQGQFNPGGVGGANATQGFEGNSLVNPWDFILMVEGALVLAGAAARRFGSETRAKASFPFTTNASAAGWGTLADQEEKTARAELWLPLWHQPAQYAAVHHLFAEGRAQVGRRSAESGLDFARAVASLGVDQGIEAFQRYGFLVRNGLAYLAAPLGRLRVVEKQHVRLIDEVDPWLYRLRSAADDSAPGSLGRAVREIDRAIYTYCQRGNVAHLQGVMIALGRAQLEIGRSRRLQEKIPRPLHLSVAWIETCDDGSAEFRIALALASIAHEKLGPLRLHWEPLDWEEKSDHLTWVDPSQREAERGTLGAQLLAILDRRLIEGDHWLVEDCLLSFHYARLSDVHAFLTGQTDDVRIWALLHGLATVQWPKDLNNRPDRIRSEAPLLSRTFALLKLLFLAHKLERKGASEPIRIRSERTVLSRLRAGKLAEAITLAERRLFASGLAPFGYRNRSPLGYTAPLNDPARLGAALLIPIHPKDVTQMSDWVLQSPKDAG